MSAIWGMIHLDNKEADYNLGVQMEQAMDQYKIDRCLTIKQGNAVFGCGVQYITAEAVNEQLPYWDEHTNLLYTADCMLDNRQALMDQLHVMDSAIPDGALLFQSYLMWGTKFTDHVLGVFSLVIYDQSKNTCTLYTDHTGSRSLYYCVIDHTVYFATIFAPLLAVLPKEYRALSEKWIATCELSVTPVMDLFPGLTPFEAIHQVLAGHSVAVCLNETKVVTNTHCYWGLKRIKPLKLKTQEDYKKRLVKTLKECVQSAMRSKQETGITLSSGLDSSSVACIAAQLLEEKNRKLYSFTSVPISEYKQDQSTYFITDESDGVRCICKAYPNIVPEFVQCDGKNACTELERMIRYLEFPHKSRQNMVWIDEIYERAAAKGCNVVLKGQYGNATISQGKILGRVYEELKHLRMLTAYQELNMFCKKNKISRKKALKEFLKEWKKKLWYSQKTFEDTTVKEGLLKKHNIIKSVNYNCKAAGEDIMHSRRQRLGFMYDMNAFVQLGALDTRLGLYHGIIIRDPLKDKRIIELCASYPIQCFVQDGVERAAVRKYMRGIVPDALLDLVNRRGLQSADYMLRLRLDWDQTKQTMLQWLEQPQLLDYIDPMSLEQIKEELRAEEGINAEEHLMKALMLCSCSLFLDYFGG